MSVPTRTRMLPLLRSSLVAQRCAAEPAVRRGCCSFSAAVAHTAGRPSPWGLPATRGWRSEGLRWNSSSSGGSAKAESVFTSESGGDKSASEAESTRVDFAFAFDIDGVLLHSAKPIPGATKALEFLQQNNIPFILLTNGGGKSEAERAADLTNKLGVEITTANLVQSHTHYQTLVHGRENGWFSTYLKDHLMKTIGVAMFTRPDGTVLVLGSDASRARRIAQGYGFKSVVTPADILKASPDIFPFDPLHEFYEKQEILPLPKPIYNPKADPPMRLEDCLKIDGILVFNDPRDWAVDVQLIVDLQLSDRGYLGTYRPKGTNHSKPPLLRRQFDGPPPIIFSNTDVQWSTSYHLSRLGQGAFHSMVKNVLSRVMVNLPSQDVKASVFGKPSTVIYAYATSMLEAHRQRLGSPPFKVVYMIGDNPESDIRGANAWGATLKKFPSLAPVNAEWRSILVRSGVWKEETLPLDKFSRRVKPYHVADDVRAAVNLALEQQQWTGKVE